MTGMATAREAFAALTQERKAKLRQAIKLALETYGASPLGAVLRSCQTSLKHQGRVQNWVTGEAVQGALYALTVDGLVGFVVEDGLDIWHWRQRRG
jgi:transposase